MPMNLILFVISVFLALSLWQIETVQFQNFAGSLFSAEAPERLSSDRFFAMPTPLLSESLVWGSDTASDSESDSSVSVAKVSFEEKYAHLLQSDSDSDEGLLGKQRAKIARCTEPDNLSNIGNANDDDVNDKFACRTDPDPQSVMTSLLQSNIDNDNDDGDEQLQTQLPINETVPDPNVLHGPDTDVNDTFPDTIVDLDGLDDKNIRDLDSENDDEKTTTTTTAMTRTTTFMMIADTDSDVSMPGNIEATQSLFESDSLMQLWKRPSLPNHREVVGDTLENIKIDVREQLPSDSEDDPGKIGRAHV